MWLPQERILPQQFRTATRLHTVRCHALDIVIECTEFLAYLFDILVQNPGIPEQVSGIRRNRSV